MFIVLAFLLFIGSVPALAAGTAEPIFDKIPLAFERNEGQFDSKVKFLARAPGYSLFLTGNDAVMQFSAPGSSIRMKFLGQKRNARMEAIDPLTGTTNYLFGDASRQRTNIRSYKKVRQPEIYPGIDVEYHGNGRLLEYDFIVHPGANPAKIRIAFSGMRGMLVDSSGDLVLKTHSEPIVQKKPRVYQQIDGREHVVDAGYAIHGDQVEFRIGEYDKTKPLVIDPVMVYSTFFGGAGSEIAYGIAVDAQGAVYISGATTSTDFPKNSPIQGEYKGGSTDAFVFKVDPTASQIVYSTFIGGSATDEAHSIAVDAGGNAYITGYTQSTDFPIVNGFQRTRGGGQEAYYAKLDSSGSAVLFSTYLGGASDDRGIAIAVDAANNAYITGITASGNFPTANEYRNTNAGGFADGFVTKINAAGSMVYSTYFGGIGNDNPLGIAVDGSGAAYVTGWTTSVNFPLVNAIQTKFGGLDTAVGTDDVFVLKLSPAGSSLDYSTYIGGTGSDEGTRVTVDSSGNAYVTGYTSSLNFPVVTPYQPLLSNFQVCAISPDATCFDAFVLKVSADGKSLVFSTYFGGFQVDSGTGISVDAAGAVYIAGYTTSFDLPTANQIQGFIGGDRDAFVAKFAPSGNVLVFSTFLGGSGTEGATGLTVDATGKAYVVGFTTSGDFTTANALQAENAGSQDVFIAKLNVEDIVSSAEFKVAPQGASSVVTKGTRTDPVFGYAVAEPAIAGGQLTGLAIIDRRQNLATVSSVGIPALPLMERGRLFVTVSSTSSSVLSIANPSEQDATVDFYYTDQAGTTSQFGTITVKAREHFSRFIYDDPLRIFAPGTVTFTSSIPVAVTSFFTTSNEASELLISLNPIVDPIAHTQEVGNKILTVPQFAEGGGWRNDVVLVNTSEDQMRGEVHFLSQGSAGAPGVPAEVAIGDENTPASVVEFDIPPRGFQSVSTSGGLSTISEVPFTINRGASLRTPGAGPFQVTGWAAADSEDPAALLNGLEIIEYRQFGITQSQLGIAAPALRQSGRFFAESTDSARSLLSIVNPNTDDVTVEIFLTDDAGTSSEPVTIAVPAAGQVTQFLTEQPVSLTVGSKRSVNFNASLPVFVTGLRFVSNARNDSYQSTIPIASTAVAANVSGEPAVIPHFADGAGWKTRVILVNTTDSELRGEIRFLSQGSASEEPQPVQVGVESGTPAAVFEYHLQPRGFFDLKTDGSMEKLSTGSVRVVPFEGFNAPAAHVIVSDFVVDQAATEAAGETRGNTIFETSVEAIQPAKSLRFYVEANGDFDAGKPRSTRTTLAIANPSSEVVTVQLEVRSFNDDLLGTSAEIAIPANGQIAGYLHQIAGLETLPAPFRGIAVLRVLSGSGVTAAGFRILRNERLDFLVTTTGPLNESAGIPGRLVFPYVTDSTGYTTEFVLINPPGVQNTAGILRYFAPDGSPLPIDVLKLGSVQVVPFAGSATPHAHNILSYRDAGVLSSIIGVEGQLPEQTMRFHAEGIGDYDSGAAGSIRSGIVLANPSSAPASVVLELRDFAGALLRTSRPVDVPPTGQVSLFLNQVPGLETLAIPFEGVLRVRATTPEGITATVFRTLYNERGTNVFTTTGPLEENAGTSEQLVFPHIAEGGGYTTQFIVIGGASGQGSAGVLRFFTGEGHPLNMTLTVR